tara:strand:- start:24 stop:185 length:162 start_codon:yes stop_codon:yes gene_type:complete
VFSGEANGETGRPRPGSDGGGGLRREELLVRDERVRRWWIVGGGLGDGEGEIE